MSHFEKRKLGTVGIDNQDFNETVEFLSTHPSHDRRAEYLESMLPETLELRDRCQCPRLNPNRDPIKLLQRRIEEEKKRQPINYTLIRIE